MVIYTVYTWKIYGSRTANATIVVLISFMFSVLFVIVGIIGEYIAIPVCGDQGQAGVYRERYC